MDLKRLTIWLRGMFAIGGIALFSLCAVAAAVFFCKDLSVLNSGQQSLGWQRTNATIREIGLKRDGSTTRQNVIYDFHVGEKKYSSSRIAYRTSSSIEPHVDSKPGDPIAVFYNPARPAESVIVQGNDPNFGRDIAIQLGTICILTALVYATIFYTRDLVLAVSRSFLIELNQVFLWLTRRSKKNSSDADNKNKRIDSSKKIKTAETLEEEARTWQLAFGAALCAGFISLSIASRSNIISDNWACILTVCLMYGPAGLIGLAYIISKTISKPSTAKNVSSKGKRINHSANDRPGLFEYILCVSSRGRNAAKVSVRAARAACIGLLLLSVCGFSSYLLLSAHSTFDGAFSWSLFASLICYFWIFVFDLDGMGRTLRFKSTLGIILLLASASFFVWSPLAPQNVFGFDHFKLGLELEKSHPEQAIAEFDKAIEAMPASYEGYYRRGYLNYTLGNDESALSDFNKVLRLRPKFSAPYFYCARLREKQGQLDKALRDYDAAIKLWGREGEYYYCRACLEEKMGSHNLAVLDFAKAKALGYTADTTEAH